jgi:hypothetical protein
MGSGTKDPQNAKIGSTVTLKKKDKSWTGTCFGQNGDKARFTLFTDDGKPYITNSMPFNKNVVKQFYIEMDTELTETDIMQTELEFNSVDVRDVVLNTCISNEN